MRYPSFIQHARGPDFINDDQTADAAIKAVLGIMATTLDPIQAEKLALESRQPVRGSIHG